MGLGMGGRTEEGERGSAPEELGVAVAEEKLVAFEGKPFGLYREAEVGLVGLVKLGLYVRCGVVGFVCEVKEELYGFVLCGVELVVVELVKLEEGCAGVKGVDGVVGFVVPLERVEFVRGELA